MERPKFMPQNSRLIAVLLGFIGGFLDVYCHLQFKTFVATQTGNIILLVADIGGHNQDSIGIKGLSIIVFTLGFLVGIMIKKRAKTAYWRSYSLLPMFFSCLILPFLPQSTALWVACLGFSTGILMLTFTGSLIENHPYTILMTSGNYRKMVSS